MVAWQKPGCFFCSTACIGTPVPLKAYQWLVFDIQRGKADQISSFSAAYGQRANMAKLMAHNFTSTCKRGRRQCVATCAESSLAFLLYMSPGAKCLCLLPPAVSTVVEVSFAFPQWPKHGGEGPRGWPEAVPMRCSSLVMVCMLGNDRSGYLNFLLAERLVVRGSVNIDTPCISVDASLLSPTHRSSSIPINQQHRTTQTPK